MKKYKYDTHVHTSEVSRCGKIDAERLIEIYNSAGYSGILVTDHFHRGYFDSLGSLSAEEKTDSFLSGYRKAKAAAKKYGMDVLLGMELRFYELPNDYIVIGADEEMLYCEKNFLTASLKDFCKLKEKYNLLLYQAHPFRLGMIPRKAGLIDGIEVYNGNRRHNSQNKTAMFYAEEQGLKKISGSDFHQEEDAASGGILISKRVKTSAELRDYLLRNEPELIFNKNAV